jgi:cytochrome c553
MTTSRLALCLFISISANTYAAGDPAAGQEKSAVCQGCHGPDGNSLAPDFPNLASQNTAYLRKQLHDFQSGNRKNETMTSMAAGLQEKDIQDITSYFSAQKVQAPAKAGSNVGKKIYVGGNRYTSLPACAGCHGPHAVGNGPGAIPWLAGQKAAYVAKALRDFRSGDRSNDRNKIMQDIAAKMSDKEIDAVASYVAGIGAKE